MWEMTEQEKCQHVFIKVLNTDLAHQIVDFKIYCKKCKLVTQKWSEEYDENRYYRQSP